MCLLELDAKVILLHRRRKSGKVSLPVRRKSASLEALFIITVFVVSLCVVASVQSVEMKGGKKTRSVGP